MFNSENNLYFTTFAGRNNEGRPGQTKQPDRRPPHVVTAQQQQDQTEIQSANNRPLDLLTKLLNQASPLGQQQSNPPGLPPRRQFGIERPVQQQPPQRPQNEDHHQAEAADPSSRFHQPPPLNPSVQLRRPIEPPRQQSPPPPNFQQSDSFGFNPGTVILESGFKPIRKADGPIPPLGFEVEAQPAASPPHHERLDLSGQSQLDFEDDPRLQEHPPQFRQEATSDRPSTLITLDPVFIASAPDATAQRGRPRDSLPVQLPKAVVPVVPGPPQPQQPPQAPPPQFQQDLRFHPPPQQQSFQSPPPHLQFGRQPPPSAGRPYPHAIPPSLKDGNNKNKPSGSNGSGGGLASLFNFGGQRRNQQQQQPAAESPSR